MTVAARATFELLTVDGDKMTVVLDDFFLDNTLDEDEEREIAALAVGQTYRGGGGAACEWSITRLS